jgi:hypothetical protein
MQAPQILPAPSLILQPKRSKLGKTTGGTIDAGFAHQINHVMVGELGKFEVLFMAYDDGDVVAYFTHIIANSIKANREQGNDSSGYAPRVATPKQFFHENVGLSAWGLAMHKESRLLAVGSNKREATVFAFATSQSNKTAKSRGDTAALEFDNSPKVWSGHTAMELERHFRSRSRTWRIVLPLGAEGNNIPSIAFMDDAHGYAEKLLAFDIQGNTWIFDIWKIGAIPILYPPFGQRRVIPHQYGSR